MTRIILTYGLISGLIVISSMILGIVMSAEPGQGASAEWVGYLIMMVALTLIFLGIKRYRDQHLGGVIRFGTGLLVGLGISAVAGVMYVGVWEAHLARTDHAFIHEYSEAVLEDRREEGMTGAAYEAEVEKMDRLKEQYSRLSYRLPMTFLEIFPVGVLITLISAAVLRNSNFMKAQ